MRRISKALLRLYPYDYRVMFAAEMVDVCEKSAREHVVVELIGLLFGAAREWNAKLTTDRAIRGRSLPDLRMMRPVGVPKALWFAEASRKQCSSDT